MTWNTIKEELNWPAFVFVLLNVFDLVLTVVLINLDIGHELNPLLAGPLWRLVTLKLTLTFLIIVFIAGRTAMVQVLNLGLVIVVLYNLTWLLIWLFTVH